MFLLLFIRYAPISFSEKKKWKISSSNFIQQNYFQLTSLINALWVYILLLYTRKVHPILLLTKIPTTQKPTHTLTTRILAYNKRTLPINKPLNTAFTSPPSQKINKRLFFVFSYVALKGHNFFKKPHSAFKLFFNCSFHDDLISFNLIKFFNRWENTASLFTSLSYHQIIFLICGNRVFWNETLFLNWLFFREPLLLPNSFLRTLIFPTQYPSIEGLVQRRRLTHFKPKLIFFLDVKNYHARFPLLKNFKAFYMAIIPLSMNPWKVHYAIPVIDGTFLTQFFFLKFLLHLILLGRRNRFLLLRSYWVKRHLVV